MKTQEQPSESAFNLEAAYKKLGENICAEYPEIDGHLLVDKAKHLPIRVMQRLGPSVFFTPYEEYAFVRQVITSALQELGGKGTYKLFIADHTSLLEPKITTTWYLSGTNEGGIPLFSRSELADQLVVFRNFLKNDNEHLLKTGLPSRQLPEANWLWFKFVNLYPVRQRANRIPFKKVRKIAGEQSYYAWLAPLPNSKSERKVRRNCRFHAAELVPGILPKDVRRLESIRKHLLKIKVKVIELAVDFLRTGSSGTLLKACIQEIRNTLGDSRLNFCLKTEGNYIDSSQVNKSELKCEALEHRVATQLELGGLLSVLRLIGHVESEISVGTMHHMRIQFGDLIIQSVIGPSLWKPRSIPYFHFVTLGKKSEADAAVDCFLKLQTKECKWWIQFTDRVIAAITVEIGGVDENIVELVKLHCLTIAADFDSQYRATRKIPRMLDVYSSMHSNDIIDDSSQFSQVNQKHWAIRFRNGNLFTIRDMAGLRVLHFLISYPDKLNTWKAIGEFFQAYHGSSPKEDNLSDTDRASMSPSTHVIEVVDSDTLDEARSSLRQIKAQMENIPAPNRTRNDPNYNTLARNSEIIEAYLQNGTGRDGKPRKLSDYSKKCRDRFIKSINRAIDAIAEFDSELYDHLDQNVKRKSHTVEYVLEEGLIWITNPIVNDR